MCTYIRKDYSSREFLTNKKTVFFSSIIGFTSLCKILLENEIEAREIARSDANGESIHPQRLDFERACEV